MPRKCSMLNKQNRVIEQLHLILPKSFVSNNNIPLIQQGLFLELNMLG